eukprot:scaffold17903_cov71-Cylindrotheca_fusiformis.AAC.1
MMSSSIAMHERWRGIVATFIASLPPHPVGAKVVDPSISNHIDYKNHPPLRQDRLIEGEIKSNAATSTDGGRNRCQGKQGDYVAIKRHIAKKRQRPSQHRHDTNGFLNGPAPEEPPVKIGKFSLIVRLLCRSWRRRDKNCSHKSIAASHEHTKLPTTNSIPNLHISLFQFEVLNRKLKLVPRHSGNGFLSTATRE